MSIDAIAIDDLHPLADATATLLGTDSAAGLRYDGLDVVAVASLRASDARHRPVERLDDEFIRLVRTVVLGLRGIIALDLYTSGAGLRLQLLIAAVSTAQLNWAPREVLERFRSRLSDMVEYRPRDTAAHQAAFAAASHGVTLEPAIEAVQHNALQASVAIPPLLTPGMLGNIAQLLESSTSPAVVRLIVAPPTRPRPAVGDIAGDLAVVHQIAETDAVPRATAYRARALRDILPARMQTILDQPCAAQIQAWAPTAAAADALAAQLCREAARSGAAELEQRQGRRVVQLRQANREATTLYSLASVRRLPDATDRHLPLPSFWRDGSGEQPGHLISIRDAALLVMPPSSDACVIASIGTTPVQTRSAPRPREWLHGPSTVGLDDRGHPIRFDDGAIDRHVHLMGVPGSGKTTLMMQMIAGDLAAGRGFLLLDPHGDLARRVCGYTGWQAHEGLGGNQQFPGLRILSSLDQGRETVERQIGVIIEAINQAINSARSDDQELGPVGRDMVRAALLAHAGVGAGQPFGDAASYIADQRAWNAVRGDPRIPPFARQRLNRHHASSNDWKSDVSVYTTRILRELVANTQTRRLLAVVGEGLDPLAIVEQRMQLVIDFQQLGISVMGAALIGQLFLTSFLRGVMDGGPARNRRHLLYLDEVQLFFGPSIERVLQEGRKYGVVLVAAHQHASQLSRQRFDSLVGQVGLELVFRTALSDGELMSEHLGLERQSFTALPDMACWVAGSAAQRRGGSFLLRTRWEVFGPPADAPADGDVV